MNNDTASIPSVRYYASGLIGKPGQYTVDIMRETTHAGGVTDGLYCTLECTRMPDDLLAEADHLVSVLNIKTPLKAEVERLRSAEVKHKKLLRACLPFIQWFNGRKPEGLAKRIHASLSLVSESTT